MTSLWSQHPLLMSYHVTIPHLISRDACLRLGGATFWRKEAGSVHHEDGLAIIIKTFDVNDVLIMPGNDTISVDTLEIEMSSVLIIHCSVQMLRSPPAALTTTIQTSGHGGQTWLVTGPSWGSLIGRDWVWLMLRFMLVLVDIVSEYYLTRGQLSVAPGAGIMTQGDIHWATQLYRVTSVERTMSRPQYTSCVIN